MNPPARLASSPSIPTSKRRPHTRVSSRHLLKFSQKDSASLRSTHSSQNNLYTLLSILNKHYYAQQNALFRRKTRDSAESQPSHTKRHSRQLGWRFCLFFPYIFSTPDNCLEKSICFRSRFLTESLCLIESFSCIHAHYSEIYF